MRFLLDEDAPVQLLEPLRRLMPEHSIDHVETLGWKGMKDRFLLPDAARRGYDALITNDSAQLKDESECRAIRDSGLHRRLLGQLSPTWTAAPYTTAPPANQAVGEAGLVDIDSHPRWQSCQRNERRPLRTRTGMATAVEQHRPRRPNH
jgi:PIN like domain